MSYIEMKSDDVILKCNLALSYINQMKELRKKEAVRLYMKRKNRGIKGWFRKLFNKQYDMAKAEDELEKEYVWNELYYEVQRYNSKEKNMIRSLIKIAGVAEKVFVSRTDFEDLEDIIDNLPEIIEIKIRKAQKWLKN